MTTTADTAGTGGATNRRRPDSDTDDEERLFAQGAVGEQFVNPIEKLGDPDAGPDLEDPPWL